jgi:hypothetical protein
MRMRRSGVGGGVFERLRGPGKGPERVRQGGWRVLVGVVSLGLVLAALAASAGAGTGDPGASKRAGEQLGVDQRTFRPRDAGGSEARVAATCGNATAKEVIGGLLDAATGAAQLTGPAGFTVGLAVVFYKQFLGLALPDCHQNAPGEDAVSAQLKRLSDQVAELQSHIDKKFLDFQIAETNALLQRIGNAETNFQLMLKYASEKNNTELIDVTRKFLNLADALTEAPANLDSDLREEQKGPGNPLDRPALIPAVRQLLGNEPFFTNESSRKIHGFYYYYEWVQARLAAVLSAYYALGGGCAVIFANSDAHRQELLKSTDCKPVSGEAKRQLDLIDDNIDKQRATLPPVLDPRVVIERKTKRMWLLQPEERESRQILESGLVYEERTSGPSYRYRLDIPVERKPSIDSALSLGRPANWHFPTAADYRELFDGSPIQPPLNQPLARLNWLGVGRYGNPDYYLWLKGDFYTKEEKQCNSKGVCATHVKPSVYAVLYKLEPGHKSPPETQEFSLGDQCTPYTTPPALLRPDCRDWHPRPNAYIFWWYGPLTVAQGGGYWCQPRKQPSWDPAKC